MASVFAFFFYSANLLLDAPHWLLAFAANTGGWLISIYGLRRLLFSVHFFSSISFIIVPIPSPIRMSLLVGLFYYCKARDFPREVHSLLSKCTSLSFLFNASVSFRLVPLIDKTITAPKASLRTKESILFGWNSDEASVTRYQNRELNNWLFWDISVSLKKNERICYPLKFLVTTIWESSSRRSCSI